MSEYLARIQQSYSVAFADFIRSQEATGRTLIKMQTGDPDFPTHPKVVAAAHQALENGETKYCDSRGLLALREAIAQKLRAENKIDATARDNILVTHGAVHGVGMALRAVLNAGDEAIIYEPYWRSYQANVTLSGAIPVIVSADPKNGFSLDVNRILDRVTSKTRAIIINSPNNPSGVVYSEESLRRLAGAAVQGNFYLICDEVYESLIFDRRGHYSPASDRESFKNIITAFSFSKTHAMTGWRIGYVVAGKAVIDEMLKLSQFSVTSLSPFNQRAAIAALTSVDAQQYAQEMRATYERRKNSILSKVKGTWLEAAMTPPQGTFYAWIDCSKIPGIEGGSLNLAKAIVEKAGVAFTPGIAFGDNMDSFLRMCFATTDENIERALAALIDLQK